MVGSLVVLKAELWAVVKVELSAYRKVVMMVDMLAFVRVVVTAVLWDMISAAVLAATKDSQTDSSLDVTLVVYWALRKDH